MVLLIAGTTAAADDGAAVFPVAVGAIADN